MKRIALAAASALLGTGMLVGLAASPAAAASHTTGWANCAVSSRIDYKVRMTWDRTSNARPDWVDFKVTGTIGIYPADVYKVNLQYRHDTEQRDTTASGPQTKDGHVRIDGAVYLKRSVAATVTLVSSSGTQICTTTVHSG